MLTKAELYMIRGRANLTGRTRALRDHTIGVLRADSRALLADLDAAYEALQDIHDMADDGAQSPNRAVLMDIERRAAEALGGE